MKLEEVFNPHSKSSWGEIEKMDPYFDRLRQRANKYFDLDMQYGRKAAVARAHGNKQEAMEFRAKAEEAARKWQEIKSKTEQFQTNKYNKSMGF